MKKLGYNRKLISTAIITLFILSATVSAAMATLPQNYAFPPRPTGTVVGISPTLVGQGQQVLVNIFTYPAPTGPTYYAQNLLSSLQGGFQNISCTITAPDGTSSTFMPIDETLAHAGVNIPGLAQIVGSLQFYYTPTQLGNYSVTASFPGQTYTTASAYANLNDSVLYQASSTTTPATFTVQKDPVLAGQLNGYPWSPLPNDYWTNPISTDNREWAAISGDWPSNPGNLATITTPYNKYSTSPNSPHILWANQVSLGGIVGGAYGSLAYTGGGAAGSIVLGGKIYQNSPSKPGNFECLDIRTGQTLWTASGSVSNGWHYSATGAAYQGLANQANEGGIQGLLWGGTGTNTWTAYNPFNGAVVKSLTNAPTNLDMVQWTDANNHVGGNTIVWMTQSPGSNFNTNNPGFNNTKPLQYDYENLIKWDYNKVVGSDWRTGIVWNISVAEPNEVGPGDNGFLGFRCWPFWDANVIVVRSHNANQYMAGYDMTTGAKLWKNNATVLDIGVSDPTGGPNGPIIIEDGATHSFVAYSVTDGHEVWRAPMGQLPWGELPSYNYVTNETGRVFYFGSFDGHVYAVNADTGKPIWTGDYIGASDESIYGHATYGYGKAAGADNRLYFSTANIYSLEPRTRFQELTCTNETTGHFIWTLPIGIAPSAIADGYLVGSDSDNGIQYCIGKGNTQATITAPLTAVATGTGVLIQGTVMDMSPGKPNTPAISDDNMSVWMNYLYGQNATLINNPPECNGVSVRLSALDPNGNIMDIGRVTSDSGGAFKTSWTPITQGIYTIYATFDGSDSYWGSYAETGLSVSAVPTATPSTTSAPANLATTTDLMTYIVAVGIAIIIAIAIVGIVLYKKH